MFGPCTTSGCIRPDQITNTFNGIVESVAVEPSGKILVGGGFDINTGNVLRQFVVRFHETGALDEEFRPQLPITGYGYVSVVSIIVQPDSRVLLGKYMSSGSAHPYARNSVDRIFTDGILDTSLYTGNQWPLNSVHLQTDGRVIVGMAGRTFRLMANGRIDRSFTPASTAGFVYAISEQRDGAVLVGGIFDNVNGQSRTSVARLFGGTLPELYGPTLTNQVFQTLVATRTGRSYHLEYLTSLTNATWTPISTITGDGTIKTATDPTASDVARFYRVREDASD